MEVLFKYMKGKVEVEEWFDEKGNLTKYLVNGVVSKPLPIEQVTCITTHRLVTMKEAIKKYNYPK